MFRHLQITVMVPIEFVWEFFHDIKYLQTAINLRIDQARDSTTIVKNSSTTKMNFSLVITT